MAGGIPVLAQPQVDQHQGGEVGIGAEQGEGVADADGRGVGFLFDDQNVQPLDRLRLGRGDLGNLPLRVDDQCVADRVRSVLMPIIPGHVTVGRVLETRGSVSDIDGQPVRRGSLATFLDVHETCNSCSYCLVAKSSTRCPHRKVYGITYSANDGLLGGWCEEIYLKPGVKTILLPRAVSPSALLPGAAGCPRPFTPWNLQAFSWVIWWPCRAAGRWDSMRLSLLLCRAPVVVVCLVMRTIVWRLPLHLEPTR